jgi:hypothetical protein
MRYIDPAMRKILRQYSKLPFLAIEDGSKHARVRNLRTNDWLPIAGSSSDRRAVRGFEIQLRRLVDLGQGFIHAKTQFANA